MVGSHLVDYLLKETDWKIYGFCRWNDSLENIEHLAEKINNNERLKLLYGDLNDLASILVALDESQPHYVFHLGAQSYPQTSFNAPLETLETNVIGTGKVLEGLRSTIRKLNAAGIKYNPIIHVCSSSEVFGRVAKENLPIGEECSFHPASPYAISKVGTDLLGRYYAEAYGMTIMTTRMFTHTGPRRGDVFSESTFAKQIAMIEAGTQEPKIYVGNLDSLRTYADVRDAVRAYYMLVTVNPRGGEYYNIGGSYTCKIGDMLDYLLGRSTVPNIKIITDPDRLRPIDADLQVPNVSKFQKHTGWAPEFTFEETMNDLLEYWRRKVRSGRKFLRR